MQGWKVKEVEHNVLECMWVTQGDGSGMVQMREVCEMRAEVIDFYKPDVAALVETGLKGEEIVVEGYRWFGRN